MDLKTFSINKIFLFKRRDFFVVLLWGIFLGIIVSEVYWVGYQEIKWLSAYKVPYGWYETPNLKPLDLVLVLFASFLFGALISDTKSLFYGYVLGLILAFVFSFVFVVFYMWRVLQLGYLFSIVDFNWEWGFLFALWNVGKIIFPQIIFLSLLGVVLGALTRERFGY